MSIGKRALVTGGSGYFGEILCLSLLRHGYDVVNFDILAPPAPIKGVVHQQGDILNQQDVREACRDVEVVFHCVAQVPLAKDKEAFESVNVKGTQILMEAASEMKARKVVYVSSSAVFGIPEANPVHELMIPRPREAYGAAKLKGELICQAFVKKGLDVTVIRPRTILSAGRAGIFQVLFEWVFRGYSIPVWGHGGNLYQFVHADDLAEACVLASEKMGTGIFHCGAEKFGTMREALSALCEHAGTGSGVVSVPWRPAVALAKLAEWLSLSPLAGYHALMYGRPFYFDISKLKRELGWAPRYSNNQMFIDAYEWYVANRESILRSEGKSHHRSAVDQKVLRVVPAIIGPRRFMAGRNEKGKRETEGKKYA